MRRGRWRDLLLGYHDVLGSLLRRRGHQLRDRVSVGVGGVAVEGRYGNRGALQWGMGIGFESDILVLKHESRKITYFWVVQKFQVLVFRSGRFGLLPAAA